MTESSAGHRDALESSNTVLPSAVGTASDLNGGRSQRAWPPRLGWFYGWQRHPWRARPLCGGGCSPGASGCPQTPGRAVAAGDGHGRRAGGVHCFGLVPLRLVTSTLQLGNAGLLAKSDDRVLRDVETRADIPHWYAGRVETGNVSTLGPGQRGERDLTSHTRHRSAKP